MSGSCSFDSPLPMSPSPTRTCAAVDSDVFTNGLLVITPPACYNSPELFPNGGIALKKISSAINKFCYKHPRFGISRLMMYIVAGTALVYIIDMMDTTGTFIAMLEFYPNLVLKGELWRLITWVFIPLNRGISDILWVALSLYFYYFVGTTLERSWGSGKLTVFYVSGMILNMVYSLLVHTIGTAVGLSHWLTFISPSPVYLNLSMFFAFATLYPDTRLMLMFIIPVKIKWLAWFNAAYYAYIVFQCITSGLYFHALVPVVAVLNYVLICGLPLPTRAAIRHRKNAVTFSNTVNITRQHIDDTYRHKCTTCDRTDKTNPELEFRYCSRCEGFRCYCEEHIENHTHF